MRGGGGGGEGGLAISRSSPELVLSVSMAVGGGGRKIILLSFVFDLSYSKFWNSSRFINSLEDTVSIFAAASNA